MSEGFGGELERILTAIGEQHQRKVEKAKAVLGRLGPKSLGMASLSWVKAADEILRAGGLTPHENDFVRGLRGKMDWSAKPGRRKRYVLSEKQQAWFVRIYRRVVQVGKEKADVSE